MGRATIFVTNVEHEPGWHRAVATYTVFDSKRQVTIVECSTDKMLQRTTIHKHTRQSNICYSYCA